MDKKSLAGSVLLLKKDPLENGVSWDNLFFVMNVVKNLKRVTKLCGVRLHVSKKDDLVLSRNMCYSWDITVGDADIERLLNGDIDVNNTVDRVYYKSINEVIGGLNDSGRATFEKFITERFTGKIVELSTVKGDELLARVVGIQSFKFNDKGEYVVQLKVKTTQGGVLLKKFSITYYLATVLLTDLRG